MARKKDKQAQKDKKAQSKKEQGAPAAGEKAVAQAESPRPRRG